VRLGRVRRDVPRLARRVLRRLDVHHVPGLQRAGGAVERQQLQAGDFGHEAQDAVGAVVAGADGDAARVEEDVEGVQRGEAGGVGYGRGVQERG